MTKPYIKYISETETAWLGNLECNWLDKIMTGIRSKLYPLGNMNRSLEGLVYTIDTTKYSSDYATGYSPFTTGTYSSLVGETITINWGDDSTSTITDGVISSTTNSHTYSSPGTYQIKITSTSDFPAISFYNGFGSGYAKLLTSIDTVLPYCVGTSGAAATDFSRCFEHCESLTSIPARLLDKNIAATDFSRCFSYCSSLISIPAGLFDKNTAITTFGLSGMYNSHGCFSYCSSLASVPEGLFKYNVAATNFGNCFRECINLRLNANIFCDEVTEITTRFTSVTPKFNYCFYISSFSGTQGTAPQLWNYTYSGTPTSTSCFSGHSATSLTNYSSIPSAWGGSA